MRLGGIEFPVVLVGITRCRCLRGIDCRRPEVDGTYGGRAVVKKRGFCVLNLALWRRDLSLEVRGNSFCGRDIRRHRVPVFEGIDCRRPEVDRSYGG
jgi:hypothetical protein